MKVLAFINNEDQFIGMVIIFIFFLIFFYPRKLNQSAGAIAGGNDVPANEMIDSKSGEQIFDKVSCDEARHISDRRVGEVIIPVEVYLLAECTPEQFNEYNRTQYPVKLGYFYKDTWTAGLPFYLFRCFKCSEYMVGYKSGHEPYLFCKSCDHKNPFYIFRMKRSV